MKKVVVGISGGVDSSVASIILKNQGYEVIGITFQTFDEFDCSDAVSFAKQIGIEHHVMDIREEFNNKIVSEFLNSYINGLTPNPCVSCNKKIKFKFLFDALKKYNADFIATGHYAKNINGQIVKSDDLSKDQTYFLSCVSKEILEKTLFPLEGLTKNEVRKIASDNNLLTADKKDSYDVCFIKGTFKDYIKENLKTNKGKILNLDTNKIIGEHNGLMYYTIGQRRGINIGGTANRLFVVGKNVKENILYVASENQEYLLSDSCMIDEINWIGAKVTNCTAKFRYRQEEFEVNIEEKNGNYIIKYDNVKAVTPGQTCTLYNGNICIGGGVIKEVYKEGKKLELL